MKKSALFSTLFAISVILTTGCTKSQSRTDELDKKLAEINRQNKQRNEEINQYLENTLRLSTQGGQPGSITLNGVISLDGEKFDSRITLSQTTGLNRDASSTAVLAKDLKKINTLKTEELEKLKADLKKREDERSFINLGCELAESEIAGLTDITAKIDLAKEMVLSASRIFICGELKMTDKVLLSLSASEIMLKDASINQQKNLSVLSLTTGTLVLIGKNKITSLGEDGPGLLLPAGSINVTVTGEIYGDGELTIESKGANNVADKKQDSK